MLNSKCLISNYEKAEEMGVTLLYVGYKWMDSVMDGV